MGGDGAARSSVSVCVSVSSRMNESINAISSAGYLLPAGTGFSIASSLLAIFGDAGTDPVSLIDPRTGRDGTGRERRR